MPRILILYAHPASHASRINRRLSDAVRDLPDVRLHDLYETYPDFHIDVEHEKALLTESDLVVFQHPVQWYGMPALLKEWVDVVFERGWAFGPNGHALQGKDFWLVVSTGGPESDYRPDGYHGRPFSDFLPPYQQTVALCGMRWLPPLVLYGVPGVDDAAIDGHMNEYRRRLASYPAWAGAPASAAGRIA